MGNLTSSKSTEEDLKGIIYNSKLYKLFTDVFNEKYVFGSHTKKVLLKRAICTGQDRIPISFPYVDEDNKIKNYTIMIDVKYLDGKLLKTKTANRENEDELIEIHMNSDGKSCDINETTDQTCITYSSQKERDVRISGSVGCRTFYTGNKDGNSVDPNNDDPVKGTDFNSFCGSVLKMRRLEDDDFNGDPTQFNAQGKGNKYYINSFRDCNCVNAASTKHYNDFTVLGSSTTLNQYLLTQNFDKRCNSFLDSTFNPGNFVNTQLCINYSTIGGNVNISDKSDYTSEQSCGIGTQQVVEKKTQVQTTQAPVKTEQVPGEKKKIPGTDTPDIGPAPTIPPDVVKDRNTHIIIVSTILTIVISILLFIILEEL
jgi:hypothetical protein